MVVIDTSCCVKTQEEIDAILNEVARIYVYYREKELLEEIKQQKAE